MSSYEFTDAATWAGRPVARKVADARGQEGVTLTGTIRLGAGRDAIGSSLAYRCVLADGTGELDLLFLGRAAIPGLAVGTCCRVEGTARTETNRLVVWNPLYRLEAPSPPSGRTGRPSAADEPRAHRRACSGSGHRGHVNRCTGRR